MHVRAGLRIGAQSDSIRLRNLNPKHLIWIVPDSNRLDRLGSFFFRAFMNITPPSRSSSSPTPTNGRAPPPPQEVLPVSSSSAEGRVHTFSQSELGHQNTPKARATSVVGILLAAQKLVIDNGRYHCQHGGCNVSWKVTTSSGNLKTHFLTRCAQRLAPSFFAVCLSLSSIHRVTYLS